jgi:outer membrane lipoprotein-sorting protein
MLSYGAKVWIFNGDEKQVLEVSPNRGYSLLPTLYYTLA